MSGEIGITVMFRSQGWIRLRIEMADNPMSEDDRLFLRDLLQKITDYAAVGQPNAQQSADSQQEGT